MKRLALLLLCALTFSSCSIEDDGPNIVTVFSEVTDHNLPESFEEGEEYEIEVTYLLPTPCHTPAGLRLSRGNNFGDERRDIYVAGLANYDYNLGDCAEEEEDENELLKTSKFVIEIDEDEPYTFYFWTGVDVDGENVFTTVEVPVSTTEVPAE